MTRKEAVSIIEERICVTEHVGSSYVDCVDVEALRIAIEALKQPEQKWIPIEERKPEKHGRYLVSVYDHNKKCLDVGISYFYPQINGFSSTNAYDDYYWEVTAWMERPEPYQEEKNDG